MQQSWDVITGTQQG